MGDGIVCQATAICVHRANLHLARLINLDAVSCCIQNIQIAVCCTAVYMIDTYCGPDTYDNFDTCCCLQSLGWFLVQLLKTHHWEQVRHKSCKSSTCLAAFSEETNLYSEKLAIPSVFIIGLWNKLYYVCSGITPLFMFESNFWIIESNFFKI